MNPSASSENANGNRIVRLASRAALVLLLPAVLLLALMFQMQRYGNCFDAFTSDGLYAIEVGQEVLGRGYERTGCHIPYAPQFMPDLVLLIPCVLACTDLLWTYLSYLCLHNAVMLALLTSLFRLAGLRGREAYLFACSGLLFLAATLLNPASALWLPMLCVPMCHTGAILAGLSLWLIMIRSLHRPLGWKMGTVFVLIGTPALYSDRLVFPQFLAPLFLAIATLAVARIVAARKAAETAVLSAVAYGLAALLIVVVRWSGIVMLSLGFIDLKRIPESFAKFSADLPGYLQGQPVVVGAFFALLVLAPALGLSLIFKVRRGRAATPGEADTELRWQTAAAAIALAAVFACVCTVAAVVVSGMGRMEGTKRYLLPALVLPFLFLGLCLRLLPGRLVRPVARAVPLAILLYAAFAMGALPDTSAFALPEVRQPYPALAQTLDELARAGKIHCGIATYWNARKMQYLTRERIPVRVVFPSGEPWLHVQNPNTWLAPGRDCLEAPHYDFLIFDEREQMFPMRREEVLTWLGSPREVVQSGRFQVWLYDGLINQQITLALRSFLAARCRERLGFTGPASAPELAVPLRNFASMRAARRMEVGADGAVKLAFAGLMRGKHIDVGGPFNAHYEMTFHNGSEDLGTVYVPRVDLPNMSYGWPNNQSRLVTVPTAVRERGWTSVTLRGAGGKGTFTLSHFLVYDESGRRVTARQMVPGGRWRYESEYQPSGLAGTPVVAEDALAGEGKARVAPAAVSGPVVLGPNVALEPGRYRVEFYIKADPGTAAEPLGRVAVTSRSGKHVHVQRALGSADFAGREGYQKIGLELETEVDLWDCEFRVFSEGKATLYIDRVELVCER